MKKIFKFALVICLAFVLTFVLYGCADEADTEEPTATPAQDDTAQQDSPSDENEDSEQPPAAGSWHDLDYWGDPLAWVQSQAYDEVITLTSIKSEVAAWTYPDGQSIFDNGWIQFMEEHLNIRIEYEWVVDSGQYDTRLNLSLASGDIPDFFFVDPATFTMLVQDGLLADITDVFHNYASPRVSDIIDFFPEGFDSARDDHGRVMAIPQMGFGNMSGTNSLLWIRNDWLESSGRSAPATIDEMVDLAHVFMDDFGASYGLAVDNNLFGGINNLIGIFNAYHAYPTIWIRDNAGQVAFGGIQPEVRNALERLQDMYSDGILSAEFAVSDTGRVNEDILNGEVGMMFGANWAGWWPFADALNLNADAVWIPHPVPGSDNQPVSIQSSWPVWNYLVINNNAEHPEAVIKMLNAFQAIRDGAYVFPEDWSEHLINGWQMSPVWLENPSDDYIAFRSLNEALETGDLSNVPPDHIFSYENMLTWINDRDVEGFGRWVQMVHSYNVLSDYLLNDRILLSAMRGSYPPGLAAVQASLETLRDEAFVRIIMGASLDEFDSFVESWLAMGGANATQEVNEIYG